jgi:hypothetical protein
MAFQQIDAQAASQPIQTANNKRFRHGVSQQLRMFDMPHVHCALPITIRGTLLARLALQVH